MLIECKSIRWSEDVELALYPTLLEEQLLLIGYRLQGKVMFSETSFILSGGRGQVSVQGGPRPEGGGAWMETSPGNNCYSLYVFYWNAFLFVHCFMMVIDEKNF